MEVSVVSDFTKGNRRIEGSWTLKQLAAKLEQVTGIPPAYQTFQFTTESGYPGSPLSQPAETTTLEDIGVSDGWQIYVGDSRDEASRLDLNESGVQTYEMPLSEYEKRSGTVLEWKKRNQLGRFAPSSSSSKEPNAVSKQMPQDSDDPISSELTDVVWTVGTECFVRLLSGKTVRGTVAFVGPVPGLAPGPWIGVRLVSADGKNNGTVKGIRLFDAEPYHGTLVRPSAVRPLNEDEEEI